MLVVSTTNTAGLEDQLFVVIEKVDNDGLILSPRIVWDHSEQEFSELGDVTTSPTDLFVPMVEDSIVDGYYTTEIEDINVDAENLIVKIIFVTEADVSSVIGEQINLPAAVTPAVTLQFEVNEDRNT